MRSFSQLLYNFHWIVPREAARGAQDYAGFLGSFLAHNGIKAVINLRGHHPEFAWWRREDRVCREQGIAHFDAMLDSRQLPTRAMLCALLDAFDAAPRPFMIKCSGGQDRTSFASALYVLHRDGWASRRIALKQFAQFPFLHFPKADQRWLKYFFDYAEKKSDSEDFKKWIRTKYDPSAFADWLEAKGFGKSYQKIYPA